MSNSQFESKLYSWINKKLPKTVPDGVIAFAFNLYENAGEYSLELVGCDRFDEEDQDWACYDVWPKMLSLANLKGRLAIPDEIAQNSWEVCLEKIKSLLNQYLASNEKGAILLKSSAGIGVGFVDGSLELLNK